MRWTEYVQSVTSGDKQVAIAARTGVDQATISRWLRDDHARCSPVSVTKFAHGYKRPVLEAFVAAGLLDERDARVRVIHPRTLDGFTVDELLAEVSKRASVAS